MKTFKADAYTERLKRTVSKTLIDKKDTVMDVISN